MKKIVITISIGISLIGLLFGVFMWKMKSEVSVMTPIATGIVIPGIAAVHDSFVNVFLIKHSDKYIAIDAGNNRNAVIEELEKLSIDPEMVDAVFLTHSDPDHVAAVKDFINAEVYLPEREIQMIDGSTNRFLIFKNSLDVDYTGLQHGQKYTFDNLEIECISTPGHTPGSMSFLVNGQYLFAGDSLSLIDGKVGLFNDFFNMDNEAQAKSLKELAKREGITHIFSAHYGVAETNSTIFSDFE